MKIYTRKGDDGTTGLLYGGRVPKDDPAPAAYGSVDEAQAAIGMARAETRADPSDSPGELGEI
ncbi:ATP:cob(I)alamin adenosyltransferase, partial [Escherichia coli]|uniref:ATP:cob(I)alamin adenosyltransferase n=1 Tax=Escherichia coli TaxID=562 RepID=UPI003C2FA083